MKICFINPSVGTTAGGSETIILQFAEHLSNKHEVLILTGRNRHKPIKMEKMDTPYELITAPFWLRFTPLNTYVSKLSRRLTPYKTESFSFYYNVVLRQKLMKRIKKMDVISTHYWLDSRLFSKLALKFGIPSVFHILGGPYAKDYLKADKSTLYVAASQYSRSIIRKTHGMNIEDVVTPGIPSRLLTQKREEGGRNKDLLFVGRLQHSKGIFELINIFYELSKFDKELKLTIIGGGYAFKELQEKIRRLGLEGKIALTGELPYSKVLERYLYSRLLIFPSKSETFGMVPLEAMACGLPVITSDIPALRESTGGNAILLNPNDKNTWIENIEKLLTDEDLWKELSIKGREWASQFTWENKAEEYEKALIKARERFVREGKP